MNTHIYFLTLPAVLLVAVAIQKFLAKRLELKHFAVALAIGLVLGAPFYVHNYLAFGYLNGPNGPVQSEPGKGLISPFNPDVVYYDVWMSGLNAFIHRNDAFARIDAILKLPIGTKPFWLILTGVLTATILVGFVEFARQKPALAVSALAFLPPIYFGDGFWRYTGAMPALFAVFFALGTSAAEKFAGKNGWFVKLLAAGFFAILIAQTVITVEQVKAGKSGLHSFILRVPELTGGEKFCQLQPDGSFVAPLSTLLLNELVDACGPQGRIKPELTMEMGRWVLVLYDNANFNEGHKKYFDRALAGYEKIASAEKPPVEFSLWKRT